MRDVTFLMDIGHRHGHAHGHGIRLVGEWLFMKNMAKNRFKVYGIVAPLVSLAFLVVGIGYFVSYVTVILNLRGFSDSIIGYVHSAYYAGMLVGAFKAEKLIHRVNHIRSLAIFASLCSVTILLQSLFFYPLVWMILRFAAGYYLAGLYVVIESWLIERSSEDHRGRTLSLYMIVFNFSYALGQLFLQVINNETLEPYIIAGLFCTLGVVPICLTTYSTPDISEPVIMKLSSVIKRSPLGFSGCVITGIILTGIYSFGPTTAEGYQVSPGYFMSVIIVGGVVLVWPLGKLSDVFDRQMIIILVSLLTALPCFFLFTSTPSGVPFFLLLFSLGGIVYVLYPISLSHACDRIDPKSITSLTGLLFLAFGIGSVVGPLITPYYIKLFGPKGLFLFVSSFSVVLAFIGMATKLLKKDIPLDDQVEFVVLPRTSPVLYDLDPRADDDSTEK